MYNIYIYYKEPGDTKESSDWYRLTSNALSTVRKWYKEGVTIDALYIHEFYGVGKDGIEISEDPCEVLEKDVPISLEVYDNWSSYIKRKYIKENRKG